jgi:F-type H+-transporting ATPase subunit b
MKFNIWTFLLQVINFVVLVFILKRLLYKPVREIMEKRRSLTEKNIEEAENTKKEATELKKRYQEEMDKFDKAKTLRLENLKEVIAVERLELIKKAEEDAAKIIEKERAVFDIEKSRVQTDLKAKAIENISIFAEKIFTDISDEGLHKAIFRKLLKETADIASDISGIKEKDEVIAIDLITAYPAPEDELKQFREIMESHTGKKVAVNAVVDKTLIAGAKIKAYDRLYDFSLSGQIASLAIRLKDIS